MIFPSLKGSYSLAYIYNLIPSEIISFFSLSLFLFLFPWRQLIPYVSFSDRAGDTQKQCFMQPVNCLPAKKGPQVGRWSWLFWLNHDYPSGAIFRYKHQSLPTSLGTSQQRYTYTVFSSPFCTVILAAPTLGKVGFTTWLFQRNLTFSIVPTSSFASNSLVWVEPGLRIPLEIKRNIPMRRNKLSRQMKAKPLYSTRD